MAQIGESGEIRLQFRQGFQVAHRNYEVFERSRGDFERQVRHHPFAGHSQGPADFPGIDMARPEHGNLLLHHDQRAIPAGMNLDGNDPRIGLERHLHRCARTGLHLPLVDQTAAQRDEAVPAHVDFPDRREEPDGKIRRIGRHGEPGGRHPDLTGDHLHLGIGEVPGIADDAGDITAEHGAGEGVEDLEPDCSHSVIHQGDGELCAAFRPATNE